MNDHSLLVVGLGAPTKICRAIVVSASVIFASSTGGNAEDAWSEIKASAKEWKETSDYFVAARDDIEIATTLAKAFGLIDQPDDQKKLDEREMVVTRGFADDHWGSAEGWISEAQNKAWIALSNVQMRVLADVCVLRSGDPVPCTVNKNRVTEMDHNLSKEAVHQLISHDLDVFHIPIDETIR
jgi:hypothetical protein